MRFQDIGAARDHTNSAFASHELGCERPARWPGRAEDSDTFKGQSHTSCPIGPSCCGNQK